MTYDPQNEIHRHKDGSINYSYYTKLGRIERSRQTYKNLDGISKLLRSIFGSFRKRKLSMSTPYVLRVQSNSNEEGQKAA